MSAATERTGVTRLRGHFELPPRLVDWTALGLVVSAIATGILSFLRPGWLVVAAHGAGGLALAVVLFWKLRRVHGRLTRPTNWDRTTPVSVLAALLALAALALGVAWSSGVYLDFWLWTGLTVHAVLGVAVLPLVLLHLLGRWRVPQTADFHERRAVVGSVAAALFGILAWRVQRALNHSLPTAGADHRFTGSRPAGGDAPGDTGEGGFPVTSWVADDPDPVDLESWELRIGGRVERELALEYDDLAGDTSQKAVLDCTSGWYAVADWEGVRVGDLLDAAGTTPDARWVRFTSVTGYRWSLPLEEARDALLATREGGKPLSHGHGRPLRLVAPGRRGFQWVKWIESVEVQAGRDPGQWVAIFTSWLAE
jgi:hypothetical protein